MKIEELKLRYRDHEPVGRVFSFLREDRDPRVCLRGLSGSSLPTLVSAVVMDSRKPHLFIFPDQEEAAYFYHDLIQFVGSVPVHYFPSSYKRSVQFMKTDEGNLILRTRVMNEIGTWNVHTSNEQPLLIVTYAEALAEKVVTHENLVQNTLILSTGERLSTEFLHEVLREYKFTRVDFVYEPGQYAIRGSIVDIFSFADDLPYRVDFFGEEVESIRTFDIETQLSIERKESLSIVPNMQTRYARETRQHFLDFVPRDTLLWCRKPLFVTDKIQQLLDNTVFRQTGDEPIPVDKNTLLSSGHETRSKMEAFRWIVLGWEQMEKETHTIEFSTTPQPPFQKNFELFASHLSENTSEGITNVIVSENPSQIERLRSIFAHVNAEVQFEPMIASLHEGFVDRDIRLAVYTDHQVFERFHKYKIQKHFSRRESLTIKEINGLQPGDYVVHVDHGIGIFGGLEKTFNNGKAQETIRLVYQDNDVLFVSIHSLHKISKYKGKDTGAPKIYKLGTAAWQNLKQNTKRRVKDIAKDLIALYAQRKASEGFQFSPDTYLQEELEASFIYEDTPDQVKATRAVKEGMESTMPMDRLICGDVGFGKTEVAIRAAFKAVNDSKQVAVLVPTTILALQHYKTFSERLDKFPCKVDYISRLRTTKEQKKTLDELKNGQVDIIIGTHRLIGSDIAFKDLGLLIVDEEQKFGVAVKEKLKRLKLNVDTLTLTATPIPRTLQFSLMGARDLSIINTPPPNRHPVTTELHTFNEDLIREAIVFEVERGGQVFFIHNRIDNLPEIQAMIARVCPGVRTMAAHGQMDGKKLEQIMLEFINGEHDVLVSTSIVESGLDIPNANTIIINNAHGFGLSDLHQLRGRVGRSNTKAFCYLLAPPASTLTPEARRRLKAIEDFSELGSGFNISMQDLDIRGAGNLLGGEQSGFIADIGFETYQRILNEALMELKENEFRAYFQDEKAQQQKETEKEMARQMENFVFVTDCQIDTDMELLIPDEYIDNVTERIRLYRELDMMENEEALNLFEQSLVDRFGPIPTPTKDLIQVLRLRWLAIKTGIEKIVLKGGRMSMHFIPDQQSAYYQSPVFGKVLQFVQHNPRSVKMKEARDKLSMTVEAIPGVRQAIAFLEKIWNQPN